MDTLSKSLLFLSFLFVVACKSEVQEDQNVELQEQRTSQISISKKQFESSGMVNGQLEKKVFAKTLTVNGTIKLPSKSKAVVSSILSGTVGEIKFLEGQWVKRGQALFSVRNPILIDLQEEFLVLQSKMEYLREEQMRKQQLFEENLSPRQEFVLAKSDYQANYAKFKTVSQKLKMYGVDVKKLTLDKLTSLMMIYSPISGYISSINVLRGQYIDPTTEVLKVDSKSDTYLELMVLERDASLISKGQEVVFSVAGAPFKSNKAFVNLVQPSISQNGMVSVHCRIEDAKDLLPGMYATADLIVESYESSALPEDAIVQTDGINQVLVLVSNNGEDSHYQLFAIDTGIVKGGYVEIKNFKHLEDKNILTKGGYFLVN